MVQALHRYLLLNKRLLKKKSYLIMLLTVPVLVALLNFISNQEAGVATIAVAKLQSDAVNDAVVSDLLDNPGSLDYIFYEDADAARAAVSSKKVSEAWIFPADLERSFVEIARDGHTDNCIQVIACEDNVTHMLTREVLNARLYKYYSKAIVEQYILSKYGEEIDIGNLYYSYDIDGNLFEMGYIDGSSEDNQSYLIMPLRGMLALWLTLCALAASMYYIEDYKNGLFIWWNTKFPILRDFMYYVVIVFIPSIIFLLGVYMGGIFTSLKREIVALLLFDCAIIAFANIIRLLAGSVKNIGIVTPVIIIMSAVFSPVFIDFKQARSIQRYVFQYHYLGCIHDGYFIRSLLTYVIIEIIIWLMVKLIKEGFRK